MEQKNEERKVRVFLIITNVILTICIVLLSFALHHFLTLNTLTGFQVFLKVLCIMGLISFSTSLLVFILMFFISRKNIEFTDEELKEMESEYKEMQRITELKQLRKRKL